MNSSMKGLIRWSEEDEKRLCYLFDAAMVKHQFDARPAIREVAPQINRSLLATEARLVRLGKLACHAFE